MASKYAYCSKGMQFGFRVSPESKLMFSKDEPTPVDESEAMICESYVASGFLDRVGENPMEGKAKEGTPTKVKGPGGKTETKGVSPTVDAREKKPSPQPEPKKAPAK